MARRCDLTGVGVLTGNNVSHAHNKTRRRYLPNLHKVSLLSETLGSKVSLRICAKTLRSIEHNGGLDKWLVKTSNTKLTTEGLKIKKRILKSAAKKAE